MPTYSDDDLERMAAAARVDAAVVRRHAARFEIAAEWYRLDRGGLDEGRRPAEPDLPSVRRKKMQAIANGCRSILNNVRASAREKRIEASWRRLLRALGIHGPADAADGPGDPDIFQVLTFPEGSNEEHVLGLVQRLVRVPQFQDDVDAVTELERLAEAAIRAVTRVGDLTVPKGHHGDRAINDWIAAMMSIYRAVTGREPATSVGAPEREDEGIPGGPLIRFLAAAAKPLGINPTLMDLTEGNPNRNLYTARAWRSRVRKIRAASPSGQNGM